MLNPTRDTPSDEENAVPITQENATPPALPPAREGPAPPRPPAYDPVFFTGNLPAPVGEVAKLFRNNFNMLKQRTDADALFEFLNDDGCDLRDLNGSHDRCFVAMVSVPNTTKIRLIYGLGVGTASIGTVSPLSGKFLALYGEGGGERGTPLMLILPSSISDAKEVANPSDADIDRSFQNDHVLGTYTHRANNTRQTYRILKIAPIPPYFVYDGFEDNDLEAAEVYERIRAGHHRGNATTHAQAFLRSCLVGPWRISDDKPFCDANTFNARTPVAGHRWAKTQFGIMFPSLSPATLNPPPPGREAARGVTFATANPLQPGGQSGNGIIHLNIDQLRQLLSGTAGAAALAADEEKKADDEDTLKSVSDREKRRMRIQCGLPETAPPDSFPKWYREIFAPNLPKKDKYDIVYDAVKDAGPYDEEVQLYSELSKCIVDRDWTGGEQSTRPTLENAAKGISPFAMLDITDEEVAIMTQDQFDIDTATTVTVSDVKKSKSKIKAVVPSTSEKFLAMLKRFANLLCAIFSSQCPLYVQLYNLITALRDISQTARDQLSHGTKASILWIVLLQSRHFARGNMSGDKALLGSFSSMMNHLHSKMCGLIGHVEVPRELMNTPSTGNKRQSAQESIKSSPSGGDSKMWKQGHGPDKKDMFTNANGEHWSIGSFFEKPMREANFPSLAKVCSYCNIEKAQLVPGTDICQNYYIIGACKFGKACKFKHVTPSAPQKEDIKTMLKRFFDQPLGLRTDSK